jgi:hypothetical protein
LQNGQISLLSNECSITTWYISWEVDSTVNLQILPFILILINTCNWLNSYNKIAISSLFIYSVEEAVTLMTIYTFDWLFRAVRWLIVLLRAVEQMGLKEQADFLWQNLLQGSLIASARALNFLLIINNIF